MKSKRTLSGPFFSCFLKPEAFAKLPAKELLTLNLFDENNLLSWKQVFTFTNDNHPKSFVEKVMVAYQSAGCYLQRTTWFLKI